MLTTKETNVAVTARMGNPGANRSARYSGVRRPRLDADRADPHARQRASSIARQDPPPGVSPEAAEAEVWEVLELNR